MKVSEGAVAVRSLSVAVCLVSGVRGAGGGQVPHLQGPPHLREALPPSGPRVLGV